MTTLRISEVQNEALAVDLCDLIDMLAPRSLDANWVVSPVVLDDARLGRSIEEFMVVDTDRLDLFAATGSPVSGAMLSEAAHEARQVIWGQFVARLPGCSDAWIGIRAVDSTFYEITTSDETVLDRIRSTYNDVRVAAGPVTSCPIERI